MNKMFALVLHVSKYSDFMRVREEELVTPSHDNTWPYRIKVIMTDCRSED